MIDCIHANPTNRRSVIHCTLGNPRIGAYPHIGVCKSCRFRKGRDGTPKEQLPDWEDYSDMHAGGAGCSACEKGKSKTGGNPL